MHLGIGIFSRWLLGGSFLALITATATVAANDLKLLDRMPSTELSPHDVVRIQLEALRSNDDQDRGVATAFRFASPNNKRNTGPLPRFAAMLKNGPYRLMLQFAHAAYESEEILADRARVVVTLIGSDQTLTYGFYLSRQSTGSCVGCWMTDAVALHPVTGHQARAALKGVILSTYRPNAIRLAWLAKLPVTRTI